MQLYLLRHAKSATTSPTGTDHGRPLSPRGVAAAAEMARFMVDRELIPRRILCSTAQRTRETLAPIVTAFSQPLEIDIIPHLYRAMEFDYLDIIRRWGADRSPLLVIGHNAAIQRTALALTGVDRGGHLPTMREKFPTGALATLDCDCENWSGLNRESGELMLFQRPREL